MTSCVVILPVGARNGDNFEAPMYRVTKIPYIDTWFHSNLGRQRILNSAKSRPLSPFSSHYFPYGSPVWFKDSSNEFIRDALVNFICLIHDEACDKRVWDAEKEFVSHARESQKWVPSLRDFEYVEKALRDKYPLLVSLKKALVVATGLESSSREVGTVFYFE